MVDARKGQGPNVFNLEFDDDDKYLWRAGNRWSREIQDRLGFGRTSELSWTATDQDDQDDQLWVTDVRPGEIKSEKFPREIWKQNTG